MLALKASSSIAWPSALLMEFLFTVASPDCIGPMFELWPRLWPGVRLLLWPRLLWPIGCKVGQPDPLVP